MEKTQIVAPTLKGWIGNTLSKRFKYTSWEISQAHAFDTNVADSLNVAPDFVKHTFNDKSHSTLSLNFSDVRLDFNLVWKSSTASSTRAVIQSID